MRMCSACRIAPTLLPQRQRRHTSGSTAAVAFAVSSVFRSPPLELPEVALNSASQSVPFRHPALPATGIHTWVFRIVIGTGKTGTQSAAPRTTAVNSRSSGARPGSCQASCRMRSSNQAAF